MSLAGGRCFASQARFFWHFVVQRHWCWRLRVSSLTPCSSHIERRQRRSARFFNSAFVVALQAANTVGKRGARNRQRHCCGKQHSHRSKQSEYIAIHEPVPRLALIESVYHANQWWRAQKKPLVASSSIVGSFGPRAVPEGTGNPQKATERRASRPVSQTSAGLGLNCLRCRSRQWPRTISSIRPQPDDGRRHTD